MRLVRARGAVLSATCAAAHAAHGGDARPATAGRAELASTPIATVAHAVDLARFAPATLRRSRQELPPPRDAALSRARLEREAPGQPRRARVVQRRRWHARRPRLVPGGMRAELTRCASDVDTADAAEAGSAMARGARRRGNVIARARVRFRRRRHRGGRGQPGWVDLDARLDELHVHPINLLRKHVAAAGVAGLFMPATPTPRRRRRLERRRGRRRARRGGGGDALGSGGG